MKSFWTKKLWWCYGFCPNPLKLLRPWAPVCTKKIKVPQSTLPILLFITPPAKSNESNHLTKKNITKKNITKNNQFPFSLQINISNLGIVSKAVFFMLHSNHHQYPKTVWFEQDDDWCLAHKSRSSALLLATQHIQKKKSGISLLFIQSPSSILDAPNDYPSIISYQNASFPTTQFLAKFLIGGFFKFELLCGWLPSFVVSKILSSN